LVAAPWLSAQSFQSPISALNGTLRCLPFRCVEPGAAGAGVCSRALPLPTTTAGGGRSRAGGCTTKAGLLGASGTHRYIDDLGLLGRLLYKTALSHAGQLASSLGKCSWEVLCGHTGCPIKVECQGLFLKIHDRQCADAPRYCHRVLCMQLWSPHRGCLPISSLQSLWISSLSAYRRTQQGAPAPPSCCCTPL
jgi:hypothetical protein